jgi:hypothetical protein
MVVTGEKRRQKEYIIEANLSIEEGHTKKRK